jgi:hypothetical protein
MTVIDDPTPDASVDVDRTDLRAVDYSTPALDCDMVMKGGITSGVVYPHAVCEIARSYRLRSVGGTSAGAIAAAAAAAAEAGRMSAAGGFKMLADLPSWLGAGTHLFDLFQPQPSTRRLFRVFTAPIGRHRRVPRAAAAAVAGYWEWAAGGVVPGLVLLVLAVTVWHGVARGVAIGTGGLLVPIGLLVAVPLGLVRNATRALPANGFGLCSGSSGERRGASTTASIPALTPWLTDELDRLAGRTVDSDAPPLTFGDLWRGPDGSGWAGERHVDLQMMTTNLTQGRPYRLPLDSGPWFFDPDRWRDLFPERVVRWMEDHPPQGPADPHDRSWWRLLCRLLEPLRPLPDPNDLPVVVATRMSLSFPVLISAVPVHAVDWSRTANQKARRRWGEWLRRHETVIEALLSDPEAWASEDRPADRIQAEVCWFSDGGITSNFPVHFFDAPLPRWPTFAIDLKPFHPDRGPSTDQCRNVYLPSSNAGGVLERWTRFPAGGLGSLVAFGHAIVDTMQNWTDNTQLRVPGYRDRVAHVELSADEGGINLSMPAERIAALTERGRCAGATLAERFGSAPLPDTVLTWDNHRWVRYRSMMALVQDLLGRYRRAYEWPPRDGAMTYRELIERDTETAPRSYEWDGAAQMVFALGATQDLVGLSRSWDAEPEEHRFGRGAPRPAPELRVRPRV